MKRDPEFKTLVRFSGSEPRSPDSFQNSGLLGLGRERPGLDFRLKSHFVMGAITKGLILGMGAPAQTNFDAPTQVKPISFLVVDGILPFNADGSVGIDGDFCLSHEFVLSGMM